VWHREDRGQTLLDWLDSRHTFSFGDYYDPAHMGFATLRVINDDRVAPGGGFGRHPHRDMEILTYVLSGSLEHRDSLGTGSVIRPGDVQRMTAGTGIQHSEKAGRSKRRGRLRLVASRDGREGAVTVRQDVDLFAALLETGRAGRGAPVRPTMSA
jgi:redox-sensitive bicupin YhaK (pirin superfamily)